MKKIVILILIFLSFKGYSQDYKFFHASSKKFFTTYPVPASTYSMAFDSARGAGQDSIYYNFFKLNSESIISKNCTFWGDPDCVKQDEPTWLDPKIKYNNAGIYELYNRNYDTLHFNFNLKMNDTSVFYKDSLQKFSFVFEKTDTIHIFNSVDTAKFYKISHTDLQNNVIKSTLNQQGIIISKKWGLVQFFQIDSFPKVLTPLKLIGNVSPTGGLTKLTDGMLDDFQSGDEIQIFQTVFRPTTPFVNYEVYTKYTYLSRINTTDSIIYKVKRNIHKTDFITTITQTKTDTIVFKYYTNNIWVELPFERFKNGSARELKFSDICGTKLVFTRVYVPLKRYCEEEKCWGSEEPEPPPISHSTWVAGLGQYNYSYITEGPKFPNETRKMNIVYFKKNGKECGKEHVLQIKEISDLNYELVVMPNPVKENLKISSLIAFKQVAIYNLAGKKILSKTCLSTSEAIDVNELTNGIYFAKITFNDNYMLTKKIIILKN